MIEEKDLIRRAGQGDSDAFRQLVETYQAPVYRLALRMCGGDAALAEDAAQEAFLAAWRGLPRFRGDSRFSTWLYRLTTNAAIDCLRREKRHRGTDDLDGVELPDGGDTPQETAERSETRNAVRAALCQLTDEHREVLLLRYMQELDYGEIARALRISEGTVKSRINRAKARLKELLSGGNLSAAASVKPTRKEGQQ